MRPGLALILACIGSAGTLGRALAAWLPDGNPVCTVDSTQLIDFVIPDGSGGIVVGWTDYRTRAVTQLDVYAQRIASDGSHL